MELASFEDDKPGVNSISPGERFEIWASGNIISGGGSTRYGFAGRRWRGSVDSTPVAAASGPAPPSEFALDTSGNLLSAYGGHAGSGTFGDPEPGQPGTIHCDQIVGTSSFSDTGISQAAVIPNPARSRLTIITDNPIGTCDMYDITGARIMSLELSQTTATVDISDLPCGVYVLRSRDHRSLSRTFIVVR